MLPRWAAEHPAQDALGQRQPGHLPASTSEPLDRYRPLLAMSVRKWMKDRGKTVKPKLTEEQTANLRMCFKMMDADGSGAIDADELHAAFKLLGLNVSKKEVEAMLDEVDRDGSGEVEYAEFLEIMTIQLNKMADRESGSGGGSSRAGSNGKGGEQQGAGASGGAGAGAGGGTPSAAALPFDIVATAYRRKKLLEALDQDNKDFLLSVAEEERRSTEQAQQEPSRASAPDGQSRGPSRLSVVGGGQLAPATSNPAASALAAAVPLTNTEFLQTLGKDERRIIDALARKFREHHVACKAGSSTLEGQHKRGSSAGHGQGAAARIGAWGPPADHAGARHPGRGSPQPHPQPAGQSAAAHAPGGASAQARLPAASPGGQAMPELQSMQSDTIASCWPGALSSASKPFQQAACTQDQLQERALEAWEPPPESRLGPEGGAPANEAEDESVAAQPGLAWGSNARGAAAPAERDLADGAGAADGGQAGIEGNCMEERDVASGKAAPDWQDDGAAPGEVVADLLDSPAHAPTYDRLSSLVGYRRATIDPLQKSPRGEQEQQEEEGRHQRQEEQTSGSMGTLVQCRTSIFQCMPGIQDV